MDDLMMSDDEARCYDEIITPSLRSPDQRRVRLRFDCGCATVLFPDRSIEDFEQWEAIAGENQCPDCDYQSPESLAEIPPAPIAVAPTVHAPIGRTITLEGASGNLTVNITTERIDGPRETIRECLNHLGFDDLPPAPANKIILFAVKSLSPQLNLF